MSAFNGKWKLIQSENLVGYSKSIGMKEEWLQACVAMDDVANDVVDELQVTDTECTYVVYMKGQERRRGTMPFDVEVDEPFFDGRSGKMTVTMKDGKMLRTHKGEGFTATYVRSIDGDIMTLELSSDKGVTAVRKLKKM